MTDIHLHLSNLTVQVVHTADPGLLSLIESIKQEFKTMAASVQEAIDNLTATVEAETTVEKSAVALINGIPALISAAVAAAQAAGATPAQLAAFDDLNAKIKSSSADLATAVSTNSPPAP